MASPVWVWTLQGTMDTTLQAADRLRFSGAAFADSIAITAYQDSTHVASSGDADDSSGNNPYNTKYIDGTHANGTGTMNEVQDITTMVAPLKINFAYTATAVTLKTIQFFAHAAMTTVAPTDITFQAAEVADTAWVNAEGTGMVLTLGNKTSAMTSHDFFLLVSASPDTVGEKQGTGGTTGAFNMTMKLRYT